MTRATVKAVKDFFESGENGRKVSMQELKALKEAPAVGLTGTTEDTSAYADIAEGIGNGTLTY